MERIDKMMADREKIIEEAETCCKSDGWAHCGDCEYKQGKPILTCRTLFESMLELLKELENEYENGFNDAMLGKQELMYEGTDGKWHKKDW